MRQVSGTDGYRCKKVDDGALTIVRPKSPLIGSERRAHFAEADMLAVKSGGGPWKFTRRDGSSE